MIKCHLMYSTPKEFNLTPTFLHFNSIKTLVEESHIIRKVIQCKVCKQLYFFEFYEEIDWERGDDPQRRTYVPICSVQQGLELGTKNPQELLTVIPRLQYDFTKDNQRNIRWVRSKYTQ